MTITGDYIPKLSTNVLLKPFDDKNYLVCIDGPNEAKLTITNYTKTLLELIDGVKSINQLTDSFNRKYGVNYTAEQIIGIFNSQLLGYGIFEEDSSEKLIPRDNYLRLRFTLVSDKLVRSISQLLTFLFAKKLFITVSILCMVSLGYFFSTKINFKEFYKDITPNFFFFFFLLNVLGILFHEFGHAAACQKFGAKSGAIGFGFYLFTPVFYADVTDAWRLQRSERLIVDLGGIYMQLIYCVFLIVLSIVIEDKMYLNVAFAITTTMVVNINPFLRFDGYWALSDLMNIPNLRSKSTQSLHQLRKSIFGGERSFKLTFRNVFLVIYGTISLVFVVLFILYMVLYNRNSVIYFPYNFFLFVKTLIWDISNVTFEWVRDSLTGFVLPLMFYTFLFRYLWNRRAKIISFFTRGN